MQWTAEQVLLLAKYILQVQQLYRQSLLHFLKYYYIQGPHLQFLQEVYRTTGIALVTTAFVVFTVKPVY